MDTLAINDAATLSHQRTRKVGAKLAPRADAERVAQQFEALFVQQIVSKMREGADVLGESSMFGDGPGADTYSKWFDSHMSEHIAKSGRVGIANSLIRHFEELGQVESAQLAAQNAIKMKEQLNHAGISTSLQLDHTV